MVETPISDAVGAYAAHPVVVLTGFMGSGKTSIGQALAELLEWDFVDLDSEIEAHEGIAIRLLFQERGEAEFRAIEHDVLRECLSGCSRPTVMALGGGAFVQSNNVALIHASHVVTVFLETPVEVMLERCGVEDKPDPINARPLAGDAAAFCKLYEERLPRYRQADLTIKTADKSGIEIAQEVAEKAGLKADRSR